MEPKSYLHEGIRVTDSLINDKAARLYFRQLLQESFNDYKTFVRDLLGGR